MNRRNFIAALATLPVVGKVFAESESELMINGPFVVPDNWKEIFDPEQVKNSHFDEMDKRIKKLGEAYSEIAKDVYGKPIMYEDSGKLKHTGNYL